MSSEDERTANASKDWRILHTLPSCRPTPAFKEVFEQLFIGNNDVIIDTVNLEVMS